MNNLLLCGFMGSGKTMVGKMLAKALEMEYLDLDAEIEEQAGMSIPEIFSSLGEAAFRRMEHEAVKGLRRRIRCVVATGGGAMTFPQNVEAVDRWDRVLFLDADFGTCYERIRLSDRPLVQKNTREQLEQLFNARRRAYLSAAGLTVDASGPAQAVLQRILELL